MNIEELIEESLHRPSCAIPYHMSRQLAILFPEKAIVEGESHLFDVEEFAHAQHCSVEKKASVYSEIESTWEGEEDGIVKRAKNAWLEVTWQHHTLDVIVLHWAEEYARISYHWILADTEEIAESFLETVCQWNAEVRGEILVYDGGCWDKDKKLFQAIQDATFDNLVLQGNLKQDISEDLVRFFASQALYETYNIPWKRGILFVGPPGNGKTHAVKALINKMKHPCLYVKSFKAQYRTDESCIHEVFDKARKSAPCILVLEDLDSLLTDENRSFFLNELDGFAVNKGIVTLATTNHPERLDSSILDRPSRFDRKYPFDLPTLSERVAYLALWNRSLQPIMRLSDGGITHVAELTEGFSFAYLKELYLSSMGRWIAAPQHDIMDSIMTEQIEVLCKQMVSVTK